MPGFRFQSCAGHAVTNQACDPTDLSASDTGQVLEARTPVHGRLLISHR